MRVPFFLFLSLTAALFARTVNGHAFCQEPRQRGILEKNPFTSPPPIITGISDYETDHKCHFPAGDKDDSPGAALRSQIAAAGPNGWEPYKPWSPNFVFRSGPCGDLKNLNEHMVGGRYVVPKNKPPQIVATYEQGGILSATVTVVGHHNGYIEFTICDVDKCGGDISENCLRRPNVCKRLLRESQPECEVGDNPGCGPIDPNNPTRWYLPCREESIDVYGAGLMKYKLPADLSCEHCVLQMYWVAANDCNPPGILEYFRGPNGPDWPPCPGEGEAVGGYRIWGVCGGDKFPEEYYTCSDISITSNDAGSRQNELAVKKGDETEQVALAPRLPDNPIDTLGIWIDGELKDEVKPGEKAFWKIDNKPIALEARTSRKDLKAVYFSVARDELWEEKNKPYVYGGNQGKSFNAWNNPVRGRWFRVDITAKDKDGNLYFSEFELFLS